MDKNYWAVFYKKHKAVEYPSPFAEFCYENYVSEGQSMIELGCGNGRDARYFFGQGCRVIALDQSPVEVIFNSKSGASESQFISTDFVNYDFSKHGETDIFYSRFSLHAINADQEAILMEKVFANLKPGGLFLIEARTTRDPLCGEGKEVEPNAFVTDHYRRFLNTQKFIEDSVSIGYRLLYFIEKSGLSPYGDEDPVLMRIVLEKP
jgi:tellurite methyltransferase